MRVGYQFVTARHQAFELETAVLADGLTAHRKRKKYGRAARQYRQPGVRIGCAGGTQDAAPDLQSFDAIESQIDCIQRSASRQIEWRCRFGFSRTGIVNGWIAFVRYVICRAGYSKSLAVGSTNIVTALADDGQSVLAVLVHSPDQLNGYTGKRLAFRVEHTPADRAGRRSLDAKQEQNYREQHHM